MSEIIRAASNTFTTDLQMNLMKLNGRQFQLMAQISSGQRVAVASDDPAAAARAIGYQSLQRDLTQYQKNAQRAENVLNMSVNAIQSLKSTVSRAQEIATVTQSGVSTRNYTDYAKEVNQLLEQAVSSSNSEYLDDPLFAGTATSASPFSTTRDSNGKITAVTYVGNSGSASFSISENAMVDPHTGGAENNKMLTAINNILNLRDALESSNTTAVTSSQTALITSENDIVDSLSTMGAKLMRVQTAKSQNSASYQNLDKSISGDVDADMSQTILELNKIQTAYTAAMQGAARVMSESLMNYIR
ncbi:MAG: hypothetical protein COZ46_04070 [Verrucomicrobia bacterium CG_4_10_14_3_um_filter_43_23]|nr:MAG: hypothetical protein AUJ82_07415 [Verrucomicrobia bacterium CG1_02_43_26]PIP58606.1 MAG: hypothetical protein COX01_07650 [Verrucomicrobia bacterium CG22_combo_CG10-13_8_21_14_all_43_17]PIX58360.1 MAG: hypothetical protein COZ46_04070 [Verrucomicrobia bacterium CG_4_10_14_3_um_filter_43_23]PIY61198.1 MAG: hypothetical protein COY94_06290 [Verrucomicrobia bacterium CG_4_10_14_0_8_um_filter_43_34]PJA44985.1 MAG: hypothetical protein CO175_00255 [Verrucomicrobia bacterium CG_4_9_14_3_um_fi